MLTKAFFHFGEESAGDLHQCFSIYRLINVADLQDGFFRAGPLIMKQIIGGSVPFRMPVLNVSLILCFDRLTIEDGVKLSFYIFETIMSLTVIHAGPKALETIPVDVLSFPDSIDVVSVGEIKLTIIVLGIVDTMLSGSAVVPCHFQISHHLQQLKREQRSVRTLCL